MAYTFSRRELYDFVWSEPKTVLAQRFGVSDVWLRIPAQAGQRFQPKLDSDSKASWTLIPAQPGQPKVIT